MNYSMNGKNTKINNHTNSNNNDNIDMMFKTYNVTETVKNGKLKNFNESASLYDGENLKFIQNKNGDIQYQVLSQDDIENMLFKNVKHPYIKNTSSSDDLMTSLHKLGKKRKREYTRKNNSRITKKHSITSKQKTQREKKCKKGKILNPKTKRCIKKNGVTTKQLIRKNMKKKNNNNTTKKNIGKTIY